MTVDKTFNNKSVSIVEKGAQSVKRVKNEEEEECDVVEREREKLLWLRTVIM